MIEPISIELDPSFGSAAKVSLLRHSRANNAMWTRLVPWLAFWSHLLIVGAFRGNEKKLPRRAHPAQWPQSACSATTPFVFSDADGIRQTTPFAPPSILHRML
ncbi:hypothetical protein [Brevundimonas sp.]|uniref:hypothetical protein n=1 Tax=Brevundimonas sp. TaxID=1871086 RepID=UPI0028A193B6|nr:hypothetical protein [Brevundimonas sp.]